MTIVRRDEYLKLLYSGKDDTDIIKIVTGMRRSGKSVLLKQYADCLRNDGVDDAHIIEINFESKEFDAIADYRDLNDYIEKRIRRNGRTYIFLDEIQRVESWEKAVNSMAVDYDADIYITGSNAYLLSSELSTFLSGRYIEIKMLPLSFREFLVLNPVDGENTKMSRFIQYIWQGSLPVIDLARDPEYNRDILSGIYSTVIEKDIQTRIGIKNISTLSDITRFVMSNIGNTTSCNNIAKELNISPATVKRYLKALEDAYIIRKAYRYDIRGKKLLKTHEKYYVTDTGVRNAVLQNSAGDDISRQLENIVYLELIRRGYNVDVGFVRGSEIDFKARNSKGTFYFQVAETLLSSETRKRELASYRQIDDNFPKTVLSLDEAFPLPDGIIHRNLIDWLLERP